MSTQLMAGEPALPAGWSVKGTRYGSQTDAVGNIVQGYTFMVQLPTQTIIQVFVPRSIIQQTGAVVNAIVAEGTAVLNVENL